MSRSVNRKIIAALLGTLVCGGCKCGVQAMDFPETIEPEMYHSKTTEPEKDDLIDSVAKCLEKKITNYLGDEKTKEFSKEISNEKNTKTKQKTSKRKSKKDFISVLSNIGRNDIEKIKIEKIKVDINSSNSYDIDIQFEKDNVKYRFVLSNSYLRIEFESFNDSFNILDTYEYTSKKNEENDF